MTVPDAAWQRVTAADVPFAVWLYPPGLLADLTGRVVAALADVLGDRLVGVSLKGSALTGDFLPHFSDVDFHAFVRGPLPAPLTLAPADAVAVQRRLGAIDPAAYGASQIQVMFVAAAAYPGAWVPPPPGTARTVYGSVEEGVATPQRVQDDAREYWSSVPGRVLGAARSFADKADGRSAAATVRLYLGTEVKRALRNLAVRLGEPPVEQWSRPLMDVYRVDRAAGAPVAGLGRLLAAAGRWPEVREDAEAVRAAFLAGAEGLSDLASWATNRLLAHRTSETEVTRRG